ncbi:hypothetical protein [Cellulomonas sp. ATA003]|uniref:hypothetical protein n=1 Tax=Cellulomonas sp. ATA003 TaxID=3073064 RepID=UPI0028735CF1|nr:hypothetical protein [Cellulomonas sp. ATA003]WNB84651.1 hypothetical protein REH70_12695 [Cellulomonas sp. ATA003]
MRHPSDPDVAGSDLGDPDLGVPDGVDPQGVDPLDLDPLDRPVPTGRAVRRYTAAVARQRGGASVGSLLVDVYSVLITTVIGIGVAVGVVDGVRDALPVDPGAPVTGPEVSLPTLGALLVLGLAGTVLSLAGRLGPVGVGERRRRGGSPCRWVGARCCGRRRPGCRCWPRRSASSWSRCSTSRCVTPSRPP